MPFSGKVLAFFRCAAEEAAGDKTTVADMWCGVVEWSGGAMSFSGAANCSWAVGS